MTCCIDGMYCAETVLKEIAEQNRLESLDTPHRHRSLQRHVPDEWTLRCHDRWYPGP